MPPIVTSPQSPPAKALLADDVQQGKHVPGRRLLLAFGALLILLFIAGVVLERTVGNESTTTPTAVTTTGTSTTPAGGAASTSSGTGGSQKSAETTSASKTISKSLPPEGVMLALLGTGAVLVLASALYTRISAIKLPGGAEIDLSAEEKEEVTKEVAREVAEAVTASAPGASHQQVAQVTAMASDIALDAARTFKLRAGGKLDEPAIHKSVELAIQHAAAQLQHEAGEP